MHITNTVSTGNSNNNAGSVVAATGDVNGDGVADFIVGVPGSDPSASVHGSAYVFFGRSNAEPWPQTLDLADFDHGMLLRGVSSIDTNHGNLTDYMSVAGAGDINGDGRADLLVGAPRAIVAPGGTRSVGPWIGRAYAVYGRDGPPPDLIFADGFDGPAVP